MSTLVCSLSETYILLSGIKFRAESWKPRETILFLTDVKVEWSSFHHSAVAVLTNRTVITENPVGIEADQLRNYAQTAALQTIAILDNLLSSLPNRK